MPAPTKKISIAEAKALAEKAKQQKENPPAPPPPEENTPSIDPPKEIMEQEEQELLRKYEEQDNEPDPDVVAAQKVKEANATEKSKTKTQKLAEMPSRANRERTSHGKKGKTRPCAMCQKPHEFGDPRSKYCPICAKIVSAQAALEGA